MQHRCDESRGSAGPYGRGHPPALRSHARRGAPRPGTRARERARRELRGGGLVSRADHRSVAPGRRGSLFVTTPALEFSCAHDEDHPADRCLSVSYSERGGGERAIVHHASPIRPCARSRTVTPSSGARFGECATGRRGAHRGLAGALLWSLSARQHATASVPARAAGVVRGRVDRAKAMIEAHYAEPLSLSMMARESGMSVFHFARIFARARGPAAPPLPDRCPPGPGPRSPS